MNFRLTRMGVYNSVRHATSSIHQLAEASVKFAWFTPAVEVACSQGRVSPPVAPPPFQIARQTWQNFRFALREGRLAVPSVDRCGVGASADLGRRMEAVSACVDDTALSRLRQN